jgi:hypothetical protein
MTAEWVTQISICRIAELILRAAEVFDAPFYRTPAD